MSLNPRGVALHFACRFATLALLFVLLGGMQILHAQTTLSEGDIAFTYVQDGEKYSFVLLRDVDYGTQVVVMSNGSIITGWIAPVGGASAGDVITGTIDSMLRLWDAQSGVRISMLYSKYHFVIFNSPIPY